VKILLVQPAPFENGRLGLENALWMSEPAALTSIAAMVEGEHEVRVLDMRLEEADALPLVLSEFRPDLVGVTSMTTDVYQAHAVLHCARSILGSQVFTLIGGHHPTLVPDDHALECVDAVCIGEGEETFEELVEHLSGGGDREQLDSIDGLVFRRGAERVTTPRRSQARSLDSFPSPARHLLGDYAQHYFFGPATPMAALQTSRGCSFDCNFCAIWEFYERKVRFLSAKRIVDEMERMPQKFVMFLDDNFLTHKGRMEELVEEIERRGVRKYWLMQGRTDFIAEHPELMKRLRDAGLMMVLSGYESGDEGTLASLKKDNTRENNVRAAEILNRLGIYSTGIFMTRPDFSAENFDELYAEINLLKISAPLVVIHMPLPGTQSWREQEEQLLTRDTRMFDLLHAVTPTKLPREEFYEHYARWNASTMESTRASINLRFLLRRPRLTRALIPGMKRFNARRELLAKTLEDPRSYLRDENEIIQERRVAEGIA